VSKIWPLDTIRELLALANTSGEARATLASAEEAELFRFAIYNFRRNHSLGLDMTVTIDDNAVVVTKRTLAAVTIVQAKVGA
jgi:hypothetical protein